METDWSVAAGGEDPLIEVPWVDADTGLRFVDLRSTELHMDVQAQAGRIAAIAEAAGSPALAGALALLNQPKGVLMTSKCDRWILAESERAELAEKLDAPVAAHGCASYIDVLMTHPVPMADFLLYEEWARATVLRSAALEHPEALLDLIIRPAQSHSVWGYGISVYHYAAGSDAQQAEAAWAVALKETVPVLIACAEATLASPES